MNYKIDYLLRFVCMNTYERILKEKNDYTLSLLQDNFVFVTQNINYLIKYGISNIDKIIFNIIDDLICDHDTFIKKIKDYEKNLTKEEVIMLIENL